MPYIHWFVPPHLRSDSLFVERTRMLCVYAVVMVFAAGSYAVSLALHGGIPVVLTAAATVMTVVSVALPFTMRWGVRLHSLARMAVVTLTAFQFLQIYVEGPDSNAFAWLALISLTGASLGGRGLGTQSLLISVLALVVATTGQANGWFPTASTYGFEGVYRPMDFAALMVGVHVLGSIPTLQQKRAREQAQQAVLALEQEVREHEKTQRELRQAQSDATRAARYAGMAEVATGVLHNMGNALNSVAVTAQVLQNSFRSDRTASYMHRMVELSERGEPDNLQRFSQALSDRLERTRMESLEHIGELIEGVAHVANVVAAQQAHARSGGLVEEVQLPELVERVMQLTRPNLQRHGVTAHVDVPNTRFVSETHQLVQILANLVRNASDAMAEQPGERSVTLNATEQEGELRIQVCDTGPGVPDDVAQRVFEHGFTTKRTGNGFGLHISALAARSLGGSLQLLEPNGRGARFELRLPLTAARPTPTPLPPPGRPGTSTCPPAPRLRQPPAP